MTSSIPKNTDCIFCKIIAGDIPSTKLLEDDASLAFMDIGPIAQGHVLLIPKWHCEDIDDLPSGVAAEVFKHLPALVKAVRKATNAEGVNILQNNGQIAGQLVPHVHFHIIPRHPGDEFHFNWPTGKYPEGKLEELAENIKRNLR